ncbi:MAG: hypothetical protein HKN25_01750 [Pyrinomonadaceae bacterium]|nr:hypothetical protein [Pyrinomonadaceae bacterium]
MKKRNISENRPKTLQITARRRWIYRLMTLAFVLILGELIAGIVLVLNDGHLFFWAANQERRDQIIMAEQAGVKLEPMLRVTGIRSNEPHPYLGYTRDPIRFSRISQYGFAIPYFLKPGDSRLLRDKSNVLPKRKKGRLIIAVLGGSVARGFSDLGISMLVKKLRLHADFRKMEFQIVPVALGGYKQPQQLLAMNYLLSLGAEFDMVINIDGFNEVALHDAENGKKGVFYAYPRSWYSLAINLPDQKLKRLYAYRQLRMSWASYGSISPLRYSAMCNLAWRLIDRRFESDLQKVIAKDSETDSSEIARYRVTGPDRQYSNRGELYQDLVGIWERGSLQLKKVSVANGIEYFHFLQPNQYVRNSKPMSSAERQIAIREDHPYRTGVETGYPLLIQAGKRLKEKDVRFYDLTQIFKDHPETIYRDDCCHFKIRGNEILAQRIADSIIESRVRIGNSESQQIQERVLTE